ncbi:MAG: aspartate carbamoyltransferase regulatory subunit [Dehalococcoidales bacterium]|jgi:aspartate carbamoyltransferase regulatory subunit|nr:aspartate carbamoyltransferase regulatory subunit [Dehalococcoidales bacterium]
MKIDSINNGIVIDHITAGKGLTIFELLHLNELENSVAIIKNVPSSKSGKKDIIKIDANIEVDLDIIGYVDPGATVNIIKNGAVAEKRKLALPEKLTNVLKCKNPRCITTVEQELKQEFILTDKENRVYRCRYCETKAE